MAMCLFFEFKQILSCEYVDARGKCDNLLGCERQSGFAKPESVTREGICLIRRLKYPRAALVYIVS